MKTIIAKLADSNAAAQNLYKNAHTNEAMDEAAKIRKLAAKMECGFEDALQAMLVKKIKFGAIKVNTFWFPVVDGVIETSGHTHTNGALNEAAHYARQRGITLKF
jgi:hypothetical protein